MPGEVSTKFDAHDLQPRKEKCEDKAGVGRGGM